MQVVWQCLLLLMLTLVNKSWRNETNQNTPNHTLHITSVVSKLECDFFNSIANLHGGELELKDRRCGGGF
jgi:hypothetical protein